ncbi:MAG: VanZ family protein [Oscillospiraceae bacterium]|nr:VanZ family protein [Oscillospiraceae bacterium]
MNKNKRAITIIFSWFLVLACMGLIFYLSHQSAEVSSQQSEEAMNSPLAFLFRYIDHNTFRKVAHFLEYVGLAFLCCNAVYVSRERKKFSPFLPFLICFVYAVSDEIHQIFIPGRACRLFDIGVDCAGILAGMAAYFALRKVCGAARTFFAGKKTNRVLKQ